jgi:SNF2 family DNA or RNA helicase
VFSQFTRALDLVGRALEAEGIAYLRMDGSTPTPKRKSLVSEFQSSDGPGVFLISLKTGGAGLNLTRASYVFHLDPWWNPAVETQATDRAHRIGQTRVVTSYKLIASGTVEERVLALQNEKRALLAHVFDEADAAHARLALADLKALVAR